MFPSHTGGNQPSFPTVPESLRADPLDESIPQSSIEPRADTAPYITPYLSLQSRLSQIWINRWTVLLLIILARMVVLISQLRDNIGDAETQALSSCTKVEDIGSAMASMPHYLSPGVNELVASGVEKSVHGMAEMLNIVIGGVEGIIVFYIDLLTTTYTQLVAVLIQGSLDVVTNVTGDATDSYKKLVNETVSDIQSIAGSLQKSITTLTNGIEDSVFGNLIADVPKVNFSKPINTLKEFHLNATSFVPDIRLLNKSLPTFDKVQNLSESAISVPLNALRKALNETYASYEFNKSAFPLAAKQQLTFCSNNETLNNFFDDLFQLVAKSRTAFIVVLSILAVAVMIPMAWLEICRWRLQKKQAKLLAENQRDPMDVFYMASRPLTAACGIKFTRSMSGKRQILVRWCIAYATSPAALFVLSLALAGFLACICQALLLMSVQKQTPALNHEVGAFADNVVQSLQNVSQTWANGANGVITGLNDDINKDLLAYVNNATEAVNNTINTFLDKMQESLENAFNGTVLLEPIKSVLHGVVGLNNETVQKGLTWVQDHAHVDLPLFPNDTFSLGANSSLSSDSDLQSFLASPSSVSTDEVSGAVDNVLNWLHGNIVQEALVATGIFLAYVIIVLIGVIKTLVGMATHERGRAEGGLRYPTQDQMQANSPADRGSWSQGPPPPWAPAASSNTAPTRGADHEKFIYGASPIKPTYSNNPYDYYEGKSGLI